MPAAPHLPGHCGGLEDGSVIMHMVELLYSNMNESCAASILRVCGSGTAFNCCYSDVPFILPRVINGKFLSAETFKTCIASNLIRTVFIFLLGKVELEYFG